jgi:acyl-CoA thioester hydrolase
VGCSRIGRSSFTLVYRAFSESQRTLVAEGETVVVYYDYLGGHSVALPEDLRRKLEEIG